MGETLMVRRRVEDEGLRVVNFCHLGVKHVREYVTCVIVPEEEGTANFVPAAAVIRRSRALFGITGRKEYVGGLVSQM